MAKTILIASGKGGTGKTSTSAHIALELAQQNYRVLIIDTDCGFKGLDLVLGLTEKVVWSFKDVLSGAVSTKKAVAFNDEKLHLLSAPLTPLSQEISVSHVAKMINEIYDDYDYIIIDCAAGFTYETELFARVSNIALIVTTPDNTSLRGAENIAHQLEDIGLQKCFLVLNRVRPRLIMKNKAKNIDDAIDITCLPLLGLIPEDEHVISCGNQGISVYTIPKSQSSIAYKNITGRILGRNINIMKLK
ncbi:MAG: AAA family ATPase [Clostridia bacterium]